MRVILKVLLGAAFFSLIVFISFDSWSRRDDPPAPAHHQDPGPVKQDLQPEVRVIPPQPEEEEEEPPEVVETSTRASDLLFSALEVVHIEVEIPPAAMDRLRGYFWRQGSDTRPTVKVTVKEGGQVYRNVALHLKGAAGSFRPVDDHPALTLNFDNFVKGQRFHGLKKISLNNSVQDPSLICEKLCRELFVEAGVPVPRAAHAHLTLNDRDLGVYVLVEGYNKQFLRRHFPDASGNLYDCGFVREITDSLSINSGDHPEDRQGLDRLIEATYETDPARRLEKLEKALDVNRFLAFVAMEAMLCHWDGYSMNRNNYRVFHDLDSDRMVFMPHGLDQMFGASRSSPGSSIIPRMQGVVAQAVVHSAEGRKRYLEKVEQIFRKVFSTERMVRRVDGIAASIRPVLENLGHPGSQSFDYYVENLKNRITQRVRSIERQLEAPARPVAFTQAGTATLKGWKSKVDSGRPTLTEAANPGEKASLSIKAGAETCVASWRTRAVLSAGTYRFECQMRCQGVQVNAGDGRGGAGIRISGLPSMKLAAGTQAWNRQSFQFQVEGELREVEFVCELRAYSGQVWFDRDSLRVIRE